MRLVCIPFLSLLLAGHTATQEPAAAARPERAVQPLLELRAGAGLLSNALVQIDLPEEELPEGESPEDAVLQVTVAANAELRLEITQGDPGVLWVRADPDRLLDTYREDLGIPLGILRGLATMGLIQQGVSSVEAIGFFETLVEAPKQVRELELTARETGPGIVEADLFLRPTPDTWFADVCAGLRPLPGGAPVLREAEALASLSVAVDPDVLPVLFEPFHVLSVAMLTRDTEERERLRSVLKRSTEQLDGSLALSVDEHNQRITQMVGIRDEDEYRRLRTTEGYELLLQRLMTRGGIVDYEMVPDAVRHRGVDVSRSAMRLQLGQLGVPEAAGETRFLIYTGLVQGHELTVRFDPDYERDGLQRIRDLIDRTLDGQIRRLPIPDGSLLRGELDLRPAGPFLEPLFGTLGIRSDPPVRATLDARRDEKGLHLHVVVLF